MFICSSCLPCLFIAASLVVSSCEGLTSWLLYVMFSCVFITYPYGVLGQVWYLIVSIPDLCLHPYFARKLYGYGYYGICICL